MKKSFVTAMVTALFVVYSLYQRTFGMPATAGAVPSPSITSIATSAARGSGSNAAPAPLAPTAADPTQSNPSATLPSDTATSAPQPTETPAQQPGSQYKDGTYTGAVADAFYGNVQVQVTIANGQITNIQFPQWPNDRSRSVRINQQALPMLTQEAIQAQSANIDVISGATDTSYAFAQSLQSALGQAQ